MSAHQPIRRHARYAVSLAEADDFDAWRERARALVQCGIAPDHVEWSEPNGCGSLFAHDGEDPPVPDVNAAWVRASRAFIELGQNAALHNRFQVGECRRLQFKPKLHLRLKGGTKRAKYPRLRAVLTMPRGGANIAGTSVALPHSEFLAQEHIRTICTRVQFAAKQCPAGSVYGHVRAISPLVDYPLEGPVYLRSSSHPLPDMVLALRGPAHQPVEIDAVGRVDSVRGGIRVSFETVPDAPVSKLILNMRGGKKGLLVNSRNICKHPGRARAKFSAQNGKNAELRPFLRSRCSKKKSLKHRRGQGGKKHGHR